MSLNITYTPQTGTAGTTNVKAKVEQHNGYADQTKKIKFTTAGGIVSVATVKQTARPLFAEYSTSEWNNHTNKIPYNGATVNFGFTATNLKNITFSGVDDTPNIINASLEFEIVCGDVTKIVDINPATLNDNTVTVDLTPANANDSHSCLIKVQVPANTGASRVLAFTALPNSDGSITAIAYREQSSRYSISLNVTEMTFEAGDTTDRTLTVTSSAAWTATEI